MKSNEYTCCKDDIPSCENVLKLKYDNKPLGNVITDSAISKEIIVSIKKVETALSAETAKNRPKNESHASILDSALALLVRCRCLAW